MPRSELHKVIVHVTRPTPDAVPRQQPQQGVELDDTFQVRDLQVARTTDPATTTAVALLLARALLGGPRFTIVTGPENMLDQLILGGGIPMWGWIGPHRCSFVALTPPQLAWARRWSYETDSIVVYCGDDSDEQVLVIDWAHTETLGAGFDPAKIASTLERYLGGPVSFDLASGSWMPSEICYDEVTDTERDALLAKLDRVMAACAGAGSKGARP